MAHSPVAVGDSVPAVGGTRVRGHEFDRTVCSPAEGFATTTVHPSYLHLHWAGVPEAAPRLVAACRSGQAAAAVGAGRGRA